MFSFSDIFVVNFSFCVWKIFTQNFTQYNFISKCSKSKINQYGYT